MEIQKVDLRGLDSSSPGWVAAWAAVTASMVEHGYVVIAHDAISAELRQALFNRAMPELFALPAETKQRNVSTDASSKGYIGQIPGWDYESLQISEVVTDTGSVRDFSNLLWPQGNADFSDTIVSFVGNVHKLEHMVAKKTLDGLGVREDNIVAHRDTLAHALRLAQYGAMGVTLPSHTDPSFLSAIVQHEVEGLEVQDKDGSWITIPAETDTITFMAGDLFTVLTNGRVPACIHRVRNLSNRDRFSVLFSSMAKNGIVSAMDELVDQENPLAYNPLKTDEYTLFRISEEGLKSSNALKEFCGVH